MYVIQVFCVDSMDSVKINKKFSFVKKQQINDVVIITGIKNESMIYN